MKHRANTPSKNMYRKSMKHYTYLSMMLFLTIFLTSCIVEDDSDKNYDEFYIDQETAITVAENLLFPEVSDTTSAQVLLMVNDYTVSKTVETIEPLAQDDEENVMYIVNYENGGFVILAADRRMEPILAHSLKNSFDTKQSLYNPGLVSWIDDYSRLISDSRESDEPESRYYSALWDIYIAEEFNMMALGVDILCDGSYTVVNGPLLDTQWGQGCGYNSNISHTGCGSRCDRAPTGCVATAMAQILKYHADRSWSGNYRNSDNAVVLPLNWGGMRNVNVVGNPGDIPVLMDDIGQIVDMDYTCDGSSSTISEAHSAFVDNFSFRTALRDDLDDYSDYRKVVNEIRQSRPVYMRGNNNKDDDESFSWFFPTYGAGHAWVADGVSYSVECDTENIIPDSYRIHMNWGWNGNNNGEYLKKKGDFLNHREMIYNIIPPPTP